MTSSVRWGASSEWASWLITVYIVVVTLATPAMGCFGRLFGRRRLISSFPNRLGHWHRRLWALCRQLDGRPDPVPIADRAADTLRGAARNTIKYCQAGPKSGADRGDRDDGEADDPPSACC
jgi:hypothetical protein